MAEEEASDGVEPPPEAARPRGRLGRYRLLLVVGLFAGLWGVGKATGWIDRFDADGIRETVASSGPWGVLLFVVIFAVGELLHVPGMVFVAAGILAWGKVWGFGVSLLAAVVSVSVSFFVVRSVGGRALAAIERPWVRRMLSRLDARPVLTVLVLRAIFWLAPALNYALAMTNVRYRDYVVGSAIGLVPPLVIATVFFDWLFT